MKSTDKFVLVLVASLALLLAGCGGGSSTPPPAPGPTAGEMAIEQAQMALTNAEAELAGANTDEAMAVAYRAIENAANDLVAALTAHGGSSDDIAAAASKSGNAGAMADSLDMKIADAKMEANMAMAATAAKLYAGISMPTATDANTADTTTATGTRFAGYVTTAGTPTGASVGDIVVGISDNADVALSEDKKTMVADNQGWAGKRYTHTVPAETGGTANTNAGDTYEAVVYSNVGEPTPGEKFSVQYALTAATTTNPGETETLVTGVASTTTQAELDVQARIVSMSFDQSAGTKAFELGTNLQRVMVPGSYHGVSGDYYCTPAANNSCASQVAAKGFALGGVSDDDNNPATPPAFTAAGGTWTFKPDNPDALITSTPDAIYASYGWWIHKSADGSKFTASAFVDDRGDVPAAANLGTLQGTATYSGGAAGKYALSSSTGGTNDAGHFTARATLEADFSDNSITGTVDNFMGADGMSRNWSVEMMKQTITTGGLINGTDGAGAGGASMTKWTIDGTAGSASGQWTGSLQDNGDDGVPKVGTGTFYTEYGMGGKMVGAFGVNKQ